MPITLKKRSCRFSEMGIEYIDFKDTKLLSRSLTDQGSIIPRRTSGTCAKHQRQLSLAVKRARYLGLLPYASDSAR
ncbi:MAG: 30S ribosomal protein S18 [Calditrichaeota bacterium]|nr:30S ribosomal protein S18 [Calditrichota bacterium]